MNDEALSVLVPGSGDGLRSSGLVRASVKGPQCVFILHITHVHLNCFLQLNQMFGQSLLEVHQYLNIQKTKSCLRSETSRLWISDCGSTSWRRPSALRTEAVLFRPHNMNQNEWSTMNHDPWTQHKLPQHVAVFLLNLAASERKSYRAARSSKIDQTNKILSYLLFI